MRRCGDAAMRRCGDAVMRRCRDTAVRRRALDVACSPPLLRELLQRWRMRQFPQHRQHSVEHDTLAAALR